MSEMKSLPLGQELLTFIKKQLKYRLYNKTHNMENMFSKNEIETYIKDMVIKGASLDVCDDEGMSVPMLLIEDNGFLIGRDCLRFVLEHKPNLNLIDTIGRTPLMIACEFADVELARLILKNGADVNLTNGKNETVLMLASQYCELSFIQMLVEEYNANISVMNNQGKTAIDYAKIEVQKCETCNGEDCLVYSKKVLNYLLGKDKNI